MGGVGVVRGFELEVGKLGSWGSWAGCGLGKWEGLGVDPRFQSGLTGLLMGPGVNMPGGGGGGFGS